MNSLNIVVAGGGGSGLLASLRLSDMVKTYPKMKITLIDNKKFIEYTPSIITALTKPTDNEFIDYYSDIIMRYDEATKDRPIEFIHANVDYISNTTVYLEDEKDVPFDFLIYSLGSSYPFPFKSEVPNPYTRIMDLTNYRREYEQSKDVLIIGGGPNGSEIGSDLLEHPSYQNVTIVHSGSNLADPNSISDNEASNMDNKMPTKKPKPSITKKMTQKPKSTNMNKKASSKKPNPNHKTNKMSSKKPKPSNSNNKMPPKKPEKKHNTNHLTKRHKEYNGLSRYGITFPHSHPKVTLTNNPNQTAVRVILNNKVIPFDENGKKSYMLQNYPYEILRPDFVIEANGLKPNSKPFMKYFSDSLDEKGFVKVDKYLNVEGLSNIFALGDVSNLKKVKKYDSAQKQADYFADNFKKIMDSYYNKQSLMLDEFNN